MLGFSFYLLDIKYRYIVIVIVVVVVVVVVIIIIITIMLTGALRVMINNPFQESFDTTFMRNRKSCQNINCFFFFFL